MLLPRFSRRALLRGGIATALTSLGLRGLTAQANDLHVGAKAPTASLVTLSGDKISTTDLIGHVVILTFWATYCEPCREELPLLSRYFEEYESKGLRVIGITLDPPEDLAAVQKVSQTLRFPSGLVANASCPGYGRIWRLPVSFVIDRDGRLVLDGWKEKTPALTAERLAQIVTPLLTRVAAT
jgi:peroxiredoxin